MNTRLFFHLWRHELYRLRWQTAAAMFVSAVCIGLSLFTIWTDRAIQNDPRILMELSIVVAWFSSIVASTLFGMHASTGERSAGTHSFVRALPVSTHTLGAARLLASAMAVILVAVPGGVSAFYLSSHQAFWLLVTNVFVGTGVLLWIATLGTGRPTPLSAAVVGWSAIVVWIGIVLWLNGGADTFTPARLLWVISPPFHWWFPNPTQDQSIPQAWEIASSMIAFLVIAIFFIQRYHLALEPLAAQRLSAGSRLRLRDPLLMRWPLIWKTVSDLSPLSVLVLPWILLAAVGWYDRASGNALLHNYINPIASVGNFLLPVMVGVHLFVADLQPGINRFWRSRAISPRQFFWTRLLSGLVSLAVLLWLPMAVAIRYFDEYGRTPWLAMSASTGVSLAMYLHAVGFACWLRHTIYSGILSIGALVILLAVPVTILQLLWPEFDREHPVTLSILFGLILASSIAMTWLSVWFMTRDRHWSKVSG